MEPQFLFREGTNDEYVWAENIRRRQYFRYGPPPTPTDVWLDAGAHIGTFALSIAPDVQRVYSYEADAENYAQLLNHLMLNTSGSRVVPYHRALVGTEESSAVFYRTPGTNRGSHSLVTKRGRSPVTVDCVNFGSELARTGADRVKLDIEGAEWEIFQNTPPEVFNRLKSIVFEWHNNTLHDHEGERYGAVLALLRQCFPNIQEQRNTPGTWHWNVWAWRD